MSQFGENYELISLVMPGRDRKACKNKFKLEDKKNSSRITFCLQNRKPYGEWGDFMSYGMILILSSDMQTLSRLTGKDFSGPTPEVGALQIPTPAPALPTQEGLSGTPENSTRKVRKKSATPSHISDVEVVGDADTFDPGFAEE